jgi:amidohydrolase
MHFFVKNLRHMRYISLLAFLALFTSHSSAQPALKLRAGQLTKEVEAKVINWRHDFHEHPELSNREFNTAAKVAAHLKSLGIEVRTGVAHTGVFLFSRRHAQRTGS